MVMKSHTNWGHPHWICRTASGLCLPAATAFPPCLLQQFRRLNVQHVRQLGNDFQPCPSRSSFQFADISAIYSRLERKLFLRKVLFVPQASKICGKNLPEVHSASEPLCCLLTNRFKATKLTNADPVGTMVTVMVRFFEYLYAGCILAIAGCLLLNGLRNKSTTASIFKAAIPTGQKRPTYHAVFWAASCLLGLCILGSPLGASLFVLFAVLCVGGINVYYRLHPDKARKAGWRH